MSVGGDRLRRFASLIGGPGALSLWAWAYYAPVNVLGPVLGGAPTLNWQGRLGSSNFSS